MKAQYNGGNSMKKKRDKKIIMLNKKTRLNTKRV